MEFLVSCITTLNCVIKKIFFFGKIDFGKTHSNTSEVKPLENALFRPTIEKGIFMLRRFIFCEL